MPVHPSGVCVPLHFAVFVLAHAPEHASSLSWYCCAVDDLLLSTCAWILRVCCSVCVPWRVCGIVIPKRQCICQGSAFPCILLCSFVQLHLCMLLACLGTVVRSTIFFCPRARGSFVFVVAFEFPGGSADSSYPSASASVRGLRSPAFCCSFRAVAPMHAWS